MDQPSLLPCDPPTPAGPRRRSTTILTALAVALGLSAPAAGADTPATPDPVTTDSPASAPPEATAHAAAAPTARQAARKRVRRHKVGAPRRIVVLRVTHDSVVLDWRVARKHRARGGHFAVISNNQVARRTKHSRVTLTAKTGIACGSSYQLSVVAVSRRGLPSRRPKPVSVQTPACAEAPGTAPAPTSAASAPASAPTATPTPAAPTGPPRDAALWPFASNSPWNTPIGSGASFGATSEARTADWLSISNGYINASMWSVPVFIAGANDPWNTMSSPTGTVSLRVPAGAQQDGGTDGTLVIVDPTRTYSDETWIATRTGGTSWSTERHERVNIRGPGMTERGVRASEFSVLGGLIRKWEVDSGAIRHALVMSIPVGAARHGYVWPARNEDSNNSGYSGAIPLGTLFAIPPGVNVGALGLSPGGLLLARALQDYGVYVGDTGSGNFAMVAEPTLEDTSQLDGMRNDLDKLQAQLRAVVNNGPTSVGGGGTPRAALAGPIS